MKAAQYQGKKTIEIIDIPKPTPQRGEVLVEVIYAGICGSDLEAYKTGLYPSRIALGHEIVGRIADIGPKVKRWKIGDRITIFPSIHCGKCYYCRKELHNLCIYEDAIGIGQNGGFAEYVLVKEFNLVKLPNSIPDKHGTVFDQIGTPLLALREGGFIAGSSAVILGLGTLGQFMLQCLKFAGARTIAVVERNSHRLEVAKKFEPDVALNKLKLAKIKRSNKKGTPGADFVFECSGVPVLVNAAIDLVRKGGRILQIGLWDKPLEINLLKYVMNQIRIQGVYGYLRSDFEYAVELVAEKVIDPEPIVTKIISIDDIVDEGFEQAIAPDTSDIKILVKP
ncbi:MAG: alcohol dehydrogenase catalytic domain-containing protein [Candidatus Lokiarchaeota archaeon]|nr:alcohol dehydrogenase catalytic domain-containing protein [Candidatus Lokiarchaeota archaeon]MBD3343322.1 alcohol dehydrogenase catalytic domain-containing protein [Candidatus Lokiarchaeota archaeon]